MKIKNREHVMNRVLQLVKQHAPHTYEAMQAAHWPVTLVGDERDLYDLASQSLPLAHHVAGELNDALGVTFTPIFEHMISPIAYTSWLNGRLLDRQARELGCDPVKLAATVLVHEWTHRTGHLDEESAYTEAAKFARAMGEEVIAQSQEMTLGLVERTGEAFGGIFGFGLAA